MKGSSAFTVALLILAAVAIYNQWQQGTECRKQGGAFVRSEFWFECVAKEGK